MWVQVCSSLVLVVPSHLLSLSISGCLCPNKVLENKKIPNSSFSCPLTELTAALACIFVAPVSSLSLCYSPPTLFRMFRKDTFFFFPPSLSFFLCSTLQSPENWVSFTSRLPSDSHFLSSFTAASRDNLLYFSFCLYHSLPVSVFRCSDFLIFLSVYFYLLVPTCCSGVYP